MADNVFWTLKESLPPGIRQALRSKSAGTGLWGSIRDLAYQQLFGRSLRALATIYASDKWNDHWYAQHYEAHFAPLRRRRLNVLEIGIATGASLHMWRSYFRLGRIFGIDIQDHQSLDGPRIKTYCGDQSDVAFLQRVAGDIGRIDIIVDDGSHENEDILTTFHALFPLLADGGLYAIEDTQSSYWPIYGGNLRDRSDVSTAIGFFKRQLDGLNHQEFLTSYDPTYYDRHIIGLHFYHNLIVVRKGINDERSIRPAPPEILLTEKRRASTAR